MAIDTSGLPFSKGEPRKRTKARSVRREKAVKSDVRADCVARDGYCRLYRDDAESRTAVVKIFGPCGGASEWAHVGDRKRAHTRGMDPEERHTTTGSMMLCGWHHRTGPSAYDSNLMQIDELTPDGCDGRLRFSKGDVVWEEPA